MTMPTGRSFLLSFSAATLCVFTGAAGAQVAKGSAAPTMLAHRAVYDLSLGKATGNNAPSAARGRIVYEFSGSACEGYVTNFRQITELQMEEGGSRTSDMRSTTFEEGDGTGLRFKTDSYVDGKLMESIDGRAKKADDDGLSVALTSPTRAKADFEPGAYFPTAQMMHVIETAKDGGNTTEVKIFDGSDSGMKVFDTLSVIGREVTSVSAETAAASADALKGVRRWPVSISYFDPTKPDAGPNYVLGFDLYENGVSGGLKIDYGAYTLNGQMTKFEVLPQKGCAK